MREFFGEPVGRISNQFLTVEYLMKGGPHIPRILWNGSEENLFAETPGFKIESKYGIYHFRGGHRFCHAPEVFPRSYIPDNDGLSLEMQPDGVDLVGHVEEGTGIQKSLSLRLSADEPRVEVTHRLKNCNPWTVEIAPWGISMMPLGGTAFVPTRAEASMNTISVFPYSKWSDPRLKILDNFVVVNGQASQSALKIGTLNRVGWMAYLNKDVLFIKRFKPEVNQIHPDNNVNTEVYVEDKCVEMESLAPLAALQPGHSIEHIEEWHWFAGVTRKRSLEATASWIGVLVEKSKMEA